MRYCGNPKHKEPWQPGRKGSICPSRKKMPDLDPQKLLESSELRGTKRYAVFEGLAFAALPSGGNLEEDLWHGFPIGWEEVPPDLLRKWSREDPSLRRRIKQLQTSQEAQEYVRY